MAEFVSMEWDLARKLLTQGLEIFKNILANLCPAIFFY